MKVASATTRTTAWSLPDKPPQSQGKHLKSLIKRTPSAKRKQVCTPSAKRKQVCTPSAKRKQVYTPSAKRKQVCTPSAKRKQVCTPSAKRKQVCTPSAKRKQVCTPRANSEFGRGRIAESDKSLDSLDLLKVVMKKFIIILGPVGQCQCLG